MTAKFTQICQIQNPATNTLESSWNKQQKRERGAIALFQTKMELSPFLLKSALLVLAFASASSGQNLATCANCCQRGNHKELNSSRRSVQSEWKSGQEPLCDINLEPGWYRFTSFVGGRMPTTKVDINRCGTHAPIWLDGTTGNHPGPNDPVVRIKACVNILDRDDGCFFSFYVSVKNCGDPFYLYYLQPTYSCYTAYCAGKN